MVQLQGFTTNALETLSLERLDVEGNLVGQDGFVVDRHYLPFVTNYLQIVSGGVTNYIPINVLVGKFTTNWFQCYDVPLNPGTNQFIVRASDGTNMTTTNYTVVFNTNDTTAPVMQSHGRPPVPRSSARTSRRRV